MFLLNNNFSIKLFLYFIVLSTTISIVNSKSSDFEAYVEIAPTVSIQQLEFLDDVFFTADGDLKLVLDDTNTKYVIKGLPGFAVNIAVSQFADFKDINEENQVNNAKNNEVPTTHINAENIDFVLDDKTGEAVINLTGEIDISEEYNANILKNVYIAINY